MLESVFNKVADLQAAAFRTATLSKKRLQHNSFSVNVAICLRTPILQNICKKKSVDALIVAKEKSHVDDSYLFQSFYSRKVAETINKKNKETNVQKNIKKISA